MFRRLRRVVARLIIPAAVAGLAVAPGVAQAKTPKLEICFVNTAGKCVGAAGWQQQTGQSDQCGGALLYSYGYRADVSVWVDDQVPDRQAMINCEAFTLGRPAYRIFVGKGQGEGPIHFAYAENMAEYYPFHMVPYSWTIVKYWGGYQGASGNNGFITQWDFSWPQDNPPTASQRREEWNDAVVRTQGGPAPMGHY